MADTKPFYNSTVPGDWEVKEFHEVAEFKNGLNFNKDAKGQGLKIIGVGDFKDNFSIGYENLEKVTVPNNLSREYLLKNGDLLFVRSNGNKELIGRTIFIQNLTENVSHSGFTIRARIEKNGVLPLYIANLFRSSLIKKEIQKNGGGTNISNLSQEILGTLLIPLPPLVEQKAIANILSSMDTAINKNNSLIAKKELQKKWLMQNLLTGKKRLKGFEEEWKEIHIKDVSREISIRNKADKQLTVLSCTKYDGLVPSLEYFGRKIFADDVSTYKVVPKNHFAYATNHIEEGSIGYQEILDEALISPMYTVFKTDSSINDIFFYKLLKSHKCVYQYQARMEGSIDRRGGLRWDTFSIIKVHIPSYEEQTAIAKVLKVEEKEIQLLKDKTEKLRDQKKWLMQVLLTGKKRLMIKI